MLTPQDFFSLDDPLSQSLFEECAFVWDIIPRIKEHVARLTEGKQTILGTVMGGAFIGDEPIYIGEGAVIEPTAYVQGPAYIAAGATVRHGGFVRENVIMFPKSILGHASEAKNSVLLNHAHAPHFAYVGDSVLGNNTNLGAGTKLSNLGVLSVKDKKTGKRPTIKITVDETIYDTGLAKLGAILADGAQTGCNSVLNPGVLIGRDSLVYANTSLRKGYYSAETLIKLRQTIETAQRNL